MEIGNLEKRQHGLGETDTIIGAVGTKGGRAMKRLFVAALLAGVGLLWFVLRDDLSLERLVESERRFRILVEAQPRQTFAIGFALYVVVSLFPGTSGKSVAVGWLFGFWQALAMVVGALTIAGVIAFSAARYLLHDVLRDAFGHRLARFDRAVEHEGVFYLLTLRLVHAPFTFVNYLSGVSAVRPRTFVWTTVVGLVPGTVVLVGLGAGLPSLDELLEHGVISLISPAVLVALPAMGLIPWIVRGLARKRRGDDGSGGSPDGEPATQRST